MAGNRENYRLSAEASSPTQTGWSENYVEVSEGEQGERERERERERDRHTEERAGRVPADEAHLLLLDQDQPAVFEMLRMSFALAAALLVVGADAGAHSPHQRTYGRDPTAAIDLTLRLWDSCSQKSTT